MRKKIQKNILKILMIMLLFIIFLRSNKVLARSYSIEDMDIQATILEDGSIDVIQSIEYNFNGSYNGIYITIPYSLKDDELKEVTKKDEKIYNGSVVTVKSVADSSNVIYKQVPEAFNGATARYTVTNDSQKYTIKVYSPSSNITKKFILTYNIKDICVKYLDLGELYCNFIGGEWEVPIKNLNIDINLPNNMSKEDLYAFGHGPYNGNVTIISQNRVNFKVRNVGKGQYVAVRVAFNRENIPNSTKLVSQNALEGIMREEKKIYDNIENKQKFTVRLLIYASVLFVYWIILLIIFEKDKKYIAAYVGEQELFDKYNPLIAGCIQGSREILARDIIAVILNLINKKAIALEIIPAVKGKYKYVLTQMECKECKMDEVEKYIYNWLFKYNKNKVVLNEWLKKMPKEKDSGKKFKELNNLAKKELNKIGANKARVPLSIRIFNTFLFLLNILLVISHFDYNKLNIYDSQMIFGTLIFIIGQSMLYFPIIMVLLYIPIYLLVATRHRVKKIIRKFTGQKAITTAVSILLIFLVLILFTVMITKTASFIIVDEILMAISLIILLTDNLMLKNDAIMIEDFSKLNMIKDKLTSDTLFEDRDIEQVTLWEKYLAYGVAFGAANKISKRIKNMNIDDDLLGILENKDFIYCINSGYYDFYRYSSLDRRFIKNFGKTLGKTLEYSERRKFLFRRTF